MTPKTIPSSKDVKRMSQILVEMLERIVGILQNHSTRIKALEEGELTEDSDEADLMEEVTSLLAQLQPESGFATNVPSDQM